MTFDPIYKLDLYTKFWWKTHKNHIFAKKYKLHGLISWIKVYKLHRKKNFDKCHIWTPFIKFDPTSKFRKTWFLYLTFVIRPPEYKANSHLGTLFLRNWIFHVSIYGILQNVVCYIVKVYVQHVYSC